MNTNYPKISIVTVNFNGGQYLESTLLSVIGQAYPNLEYIVIDGGSTDNSVEIIKKYEKHLAYWVSEPDKGLYHAIQKGFEKSSGEIMAWINSDDIYHANALFSVAEIMSLPGVNWIQGVPTILDENNRTVIVSGQRSWSKYDFWQGDFKWIQQESTFWKRSLWEQAGAHISLEYKYAGDLELWNRFFFHDKLYTVNCLVGAFRARSSNQLSLDHLNEYLAEAGRILAANAFDAPTLKKIKTIKRLVFTKKLVTLNGLMNINSINRKLDWKIKSLKEIPRPIGFNRELQHYY